MVEQGENEVTEVTRGETEHLENEDEKNTHSSRVFCVKIMYERGRSKGGS